MDYLNRVDYTFIILYVMCLVSLGLYLRKRAAASIDDYFLGGRKLPWWALGVSGMASFLDITGTMVITSFLYMMGPRGLFIAFRGGAVLVLVFMLLWAGKWHRRSGCMTGAEWMIYRFGKGPGGQFSRIITAFGAAVFCVGMLVYMIKGVGLFLSMYLPYTPFECAFGLVIIATIYTMASGFYGVVFTDMFQSLIILIAVVVVSYTAIGAISSYDGSFAELTTQVTDNTRWSSAVPHQSVEMFPGYEDYKPLLYFAFFYLFRNVIGGIGSGADPKYFGARSDRECGLLTFLWTWLMTFRWPMMMGFAVLGVFLVNRFYPDQAVLKQAEIAIKQTIVQQENPDVQIDFTNEAVVEGIIRKHEWGTRGTALIASPETDSQTAAALTGALGDDWQGKFQQLIDQNSEVSGLLPKTQWETRLSQIIKEPDKYPQLVGTLKDPALLGDQWQEKLKLVRYEGCVNPERILPAVLLYSIPAGFRGLLIIALIAASMSTFDSTVNTTTGFFTRDIYQAYIKPKATNKELIYASYIFGAALVAVSLLLAQTVKNITDIWDWIIMGLGTGMAIPGILRLYWWRFNGAGVVFSMVAGLVSAIAVRALAMFDILHLNAVQQFLVLMPIGVVAGVIGTYLFKPTDRAVLERFYKTTRPFGFWGPFKKTLDPQMLAITKREHFYDIACIPFALGWQITLFLWPMLLLIQAWTALWVTLAIFFFCLGMMYLLWYRQLPPKETPNYEDLVQKEPLPEAVG